MNLSDWIRQTGTRKSDLARILGISPGRVSQILSGESPSLELALKIQGVTGNQVRPDSFSDVLGELAERDGGLDKVEDAITAIRNGEMVVVVDDADRENEGDLIAAANKISPEQMAFMIRHTSGIVCAPMMREDARRLKLDPMVADNDAPHGTAFTISVDYREGLTTGISARERAATVHALANGNVQAADFVRPGHVFPLIAKRGGVLMRSGHTEAAVDLARLAGLPPIGVIAELVNDDGSVKRGPEVLAFAREHGMKIISVADLISYRQARERLVEPRARFDVETPIGTAHATAYATPFDPAQHLALVFGDIGSGLNVPVRLHREDLVDDVFGTRSTLNESYEAFKREGQGVLVYLREGTAGVPASKLGLPEEEETSSSAARARIWRDIGLGAQILRDLGVKSIRILTNSSRHYVGLSGFGIEIAGTIKLDG
ncbi:MAG: 3,4-dihydroxy-2-butanone-4-phosphate synthase [Parvibaculaceae bacterium]